MIFWTCRVWMTSRVTSDSVVERSFERRKHCGFPGADEAPVERLGGVTIEWRFVINVLVRMRTASITVLVNIEGRPRRKQDSQGGIGNILQSEYRTSKQSEHAAIWSLNLDINKHQYSSVSENNSHVPVERRNLDMAWRRDSSRRDDRVRVPSACSRTGITVQSDNCEPSNVSEDLPRVLGMVKYVFEDVGKKQHRIGPHGPIYLPWFLRQVQGISHSQWSLEGSKTQVRLSLRCKTCTELHFLAVNSNSRSDQSFSQPRELFEIICVSRLMYRIQAQVQGKSPFALQYDLLTNRV